MSDVTIITASAGTRPILLAEAMRSVHEQTVPVHHLVGVASDRGVADVRNALIAAATTEWVGFLDDDDLLDRHHVETLLHHRDDADVIIPHCRFDGPPLPERYCNRTFSRDDLRRHGVFPITVLAHRRKVLDAGGFTSTGWDDWNLWNAMAAQHARFLVVPKVTWTYRTCTADRRTDKLIAERA